MEDSPDGQALRRLQVSCEKHGVAFAADEPWAIGAKDYLYDIKMKAKNVDAILLMGAQPMLALSRQGRGKA